jgi:capsular exopolysaccharide synthesis family protein
VEAFRVIRTNILVASAGTGSQSVLITTGLGEGRSLVAANLAVSLAQAGKRVLLVDADMRKPTIHRLFDLPQEPGLSDHLVGSARTSEAVRASSVEGLSVLSSGGMPPNPAELLGSQQFTSLLQSWREHFDWVVIDSPPVIAVADASVIAHATSGVLFVVGADMTSRHAARRAVDRLERPRPGFRRVLNRGPGAPRYLTRKPSVVTMLTERARSEFA